MTETLFLRAIESSDKSESLITAISAIRRAEAAASSFRIQVEDLRAIPGTPLAYWARERILASFNEKASAKEAGILVTRGAYTTNDFRFYRLWFEVQPIRSVNRKQGRELSRYWAPFAKGGAFSRYYYDPELTILWGGDGAECKAYLSAYREAHGWGDQWSAALNGYSHYFRAGVTWPRRTQAGLNVRAMPSGCIFGDKGPVAFVDGDEDEPQLLALLGLMNSSPFRSLVALQMAFGSFEVGVIQRTPVPLLVGEVAERMGILAKRAWHIKFEIDTVCETSHVFSLPALLTVQGSTLIERTQAWEQRLAKAAMELAAIQEEIDSQAFGLYGFDLDDRRAIQSGAGGTAETPVLDDARAITGNDEPDLDEEDDEEVAESAPVLVADLFSFAVGMAFGRFDARLANLKQGLPTKCGPFEPLPSCSPGMLQNGEGLPATAAPPGYPIGFPTNGILVEDPGHPEDLVSRCGHALAIPAPDHTSHWIDELTMILGADLRSWLRRGFFGHHIKRYSKSRRKAPIYWPISTASGSYTTWVYAHRAGRDTLYQVLGDFVEPRILHEERSLASAVAEAGGRPDSGQRRAIAEHEQFLGELRTLRDEVARVAPLWEPNLDDGIVLVCAPLWRLFASERGWQRECKAAWDKLARGDYDWSHVALRLWPERVIPRCLTDRSLAIAHGLEAALWEQDARGKWQPREDLDIGEVERKAAAAASPAIKSALASLTEVSASSNGGQRANIRTRRAAPAGG